MATSPGFLPGESHGQRNLVGYSPWAHKELDVTERLRLDMTESLRCLCHPSGDVSIQICGAQPGCLPWRHGLGVLSIHGHLQPRERRGSAGEKRVREKQGGLLPQVRERRQSLM